MAIEIQKSTTASNIKSFNEFTKIPAFGLKLIGIFITNNADSKHCLKIKLFYYLYVIIMLMSASLQMVFFANSFADGSTDFFKNLDVLWGSGFCIFSPLKTITLAANVYHFDKLINNLHEYFPKAADEQSSFEVEKYCKATKKTIFLYISSFVFAGSISIGFNVFTSDSVYKNGTIFPIDFVYHWWLPFDPYHHGTYEIIHLLQTWVASLAVASILFTDCLIFCILHQIFMQFDHLVKNILGVNGNEIDRMYENQLIAEFVEKHQQINE